MPLYAPALPVANIWAPNERSLIAETGPSTQAAGSTIMPTAGRVELAKIRIPVNSSITNILMAVTTGGGTLTAGQCFAALYNPAGTLVGVSADQAAGWQSTGLKTMALASGPFACVAGNYFVGFWYNGTTAPTWMRFANTSAGGLNAGLASPNFLFSSADTSITTTAPPTLGAQTSQATSWWCALS